MSTKDKGDDEVKEKKTIKVSLGTAICIFMIFLLLISIIIMYYSNKNKAASDEDKTSVSSKNVTEKSNIKIDDNRDLIYDANYLYKDFSGALTVGDFVVFDNVGSYSVVMKPPFILPDIPVLELSEDEEEVVKRGQTPEDVFAYYN